MPAGLDSNRARCNRVGNPGRWSRASPGYPRAREESLLAAGQELGDQLGFYNETLPGRRKPPQVVRSAPRFRAIVVTTKFPPSGPSQSRSGLAADSERKRRVCLLSQYLSFCRRNFASRSPTLNSTAHKEPLSGNIRIRLPGRKRKSPSACLKAG